MCFSPSLALPLPPVASVYVLQLRDWKAPDVTPVNVAVAQRSNAGLAQCHVSHGKGHTDDAYTNDECVRFFFLFVCAPVKKEKLFRLFFFCVWEGLNYFSLL